MDFISKCKLLDAEAKRDWLLHQASLMVVKEPWSPSFIKLEVVLREGRFDLANLLRDWRPFGQTLPSPSASLPL